MRFTPRHVAIRLADGTTLKSIFERQEENGHKVQNQQSEELRMSNELDFLSRRVALGKLSRRDFLGRAAALGVSATFANGLLSTAAKAAGPVKGGTLKAGMQGGTSTDSLDPATWQSQVPAMVGWQFGDGL